MRSLMGLFLASVTLGFLALGGHLVMDAVATRLADTPATAPAQERVFPVNVRAITPGRITPELTAFGTVRSRRTMEIRAPASGRLLTLSERFENGAVVSADDLLLQLDPAPATAARDLARVELLEAEAEEREAARALDLARDDLAAAGVQARLRAQALDRQRSLTGRGIGSTTELELAELAASAADQAVLAKRQSLATAEARVDLAATALERARIALGEAERTLAETEVRAGFPGILTGVSAIQGGYITNNEKLADLIDPAALEVALRVSTAQFARLTDPGNGALRPLDARIQLELSGTPVEAEARLDRVDAEVGTGATGRLVFATIENGKGAFRPGDFVTVTIREPTLDGVAAIPAAAVGDDGAVLAITAEERLEALPVSVLRHQGDAVIVATPALAGREIVTERTPLLGAGLKVRPLRRDALPTVDAADDLLELSPERRAALIAFVESSGAMPAEAKARVLAQLQQDRVPARVVARIEARMGG